jgi:hypothetical protein
MSQVTLARLHRRKQKKHVLDEFTYRLMIGTGVIALLIPVAYWVM